MMDLLVERATTRGAVFDASGAYRYRLTRTWDAAGSPVVFIMLNPSTADALRDDPTIRRCVGFARQWGFGALEVVNLFAYRATAPRDLRAAAEPVGPENDQYLLRAARRGRCVVAAWGTSGCYMARDDAVLRLLARTVDLYCLGATRCGCPRHPLYVPRCARLIHYPFQEGHCASRSP